jgi:hypothetical protein
MKRERTSIDNGVVGERPDQDFCDSAEVLRRRLTIS